MREKETIEQQVAATILERPVATVTLNGTTYEIAPPTLATIIMMSAMVSQLPPAPDKLRKDIDILHEVLAHAKDTRIIGNIIAVLILGAKRVQENRPIKKKPANRSIFKRIFKRKTYIPEVEYMAELVLQELSPAKANDIVASTLMKMQIPDFFALTTSLSTANQIRPTREVEKATVSGD